MNLSLSRLDGARRVATVAGVVSIAVAAAGLAVLPIWTFPDTTTSAAGLVRFVVGHRTRLQVSTLLYSVAITGWLVVGAAGAIHLRPAARRAEAGPVLLTCFAAGVVAFVTLLLAGFTAFDVLLYRAPAVHDPVLVYDLTFGLLAMSGLPTAVALGAFAVLGRTTRAVSPAGCVVAALAAAAHLLLPASFVVRSGFFGLEGLVIVVVPALLWAWVLIVGPALRPLERPAT